MTSIRYFAYGSNMLLQRLRERCKSARIICVASVSGYQLACSKISKDGSGKATILADPDAWVYGVVFDISSEDATELDQIEGRGNGYERIALTAFTHPAGSSIPVIAYIADKDFLDSTLRPYDWCLAFVVAGAKQHNLPYDYVTMLQAICAWPDPDPDRQTARAARTILARIEPRL